MYIYEKDDKNLPTDIDDYYEEVASQEEAYLENAEEEVRMILEADDPPVVQGESPNEERELAAKELITGDSDDPPLSDKAVEDMLRQCYSIR